ncbi:WD40 repeat-like protein [Xylariaceae sp. FL0016]|nr:WD40 repeat-like protein [Xylariaceae sp. FL0016]
MVSYTSYQLYWDWRYAVDKEFTASSGEPFAYAEDGKQEWGDEIKKFSFGEKPHDACISSDGSRLAVAVKHDIHIIDTNTWEVINILRGHISNVDDMSFKPGDASVLVSSAPHSYAENTPTQPVIMIWDTEKASSDALPDKATLTAVSTTAALCAARDLAPMNVMLDEAEKQKLAELFEPVLTRVVNAHSTANRFKISGSLQTSHRSQVFSPSGRWMAYLPGSRPRSNAHDSWKINICSAQDWSVFLELDAHTDAIMWKGWNSDESLFGSVAWDGRVCIREATSGKILYEFQTNCQNWAGGFSPDSRYFFGSAGDGSLHIYSLVDGSTHWTFDQGRHGRWIRALDWRHDSRLLAMGCQGYGKVLLIDVEEKVILQERRLSAAASQPDGEELRGCMGGFIEISKVYFVDGGNKIATFTHADGSIEVFDIANQVKWRFARGGTDSGPKSVEWIGENGKVMSKGGSTMVAWDDGKRRQTFFASVDFDGVRIWSIEQSTPVQQ